MERYQQVKLYKQVKANDRKALEILFEQYYSSLCNFAMLIVKKEELAEEVVSDIFFILWRDRHHLEINHSVKAYLFRSVRNHALKAVGEKSVIFEEIEDESARMVIDRTPESDYLYQELSNTYKQAYNTLPGKCKQIFKLHKIDGLKYQEVSDVLNISIKTVENHMLKALKAIRRAVVNYQVEET
ncbi:RNA polymerase sigma-70 factor [Fulvivirga sp. M361]|uniref:RNA polymerase sigma-70 factor n=1 Tax=Fulvivirga sp. M361 TaxID=2594266 RepID=UPI00117A1E5F|nr:RNA polymerase sigma-70 factor [Fulvivirga sp. M361]TRX58696.1 RNA polymerase sigma-70 factor [Fulvivirga sp. M361]